ncbi:MAG TPA: ATP-binding protein [Noviherbaspirillum sp.]|nr:ATP-binding protein [Noviherbaspirillum sp.]
MQSRHDARHESLYQAMRRLSRLLADPLRAAITSIMLVILVALLDFATGYEMRLAMLYTVPIALATWVGGARAGALAGAAAVASWGIGFHPTHIYSHPLFYYWEGLMLVMTFAIFILLLHYLRASLARADRRFLHVLDSMPAGIYVTGETSGRLLYANRRFGDLVGEPTDERARRFEQRLHEPSPRPHEDDMPFHNREARDEASGRWYLVQSGSIPWEDEERVLLKVVMDITDSKQAEALRQQHHELLHSSARSAVLAEIATTLGHEINQPLMAIATYLDAGKLLLARQEPALDDVKAALEKARGQVTRASDIVERTRSFLRRRSPTLIHGDINKAAWEAAQALELELQEAGVHIDMELGENLPAVLFDSTLVEQVLINLLRNAAEAMQDSTQERRIVLRTARDQDGGLAVSVSDTGPGIPPPVAERLFTPFVTTKPQGLGLGLCICRSIIEAHGGALWHEAGEAGGAVFQFTLCAGAAHAKPEA